MIELILGGSGSGKSEYAESRSLTLNQGEKLYIATMFPYDEESKKRIGKHKKMRADKNFITAECYTSLKSLQEYKTDTVLLECMSNLVANEMFLDTGAKEEAVKEILQGIRQLQSLYKNIILVSNDIFCDGVAYTDDMALYLSYLAQINNQIAMEADVVVEVVCGIPIIHKGGQGNETACG